MNSQASPHHFPLSGAPEPFWDAVKAVGNIISPVYLVGGSVRDALLGLVPHDYDFSTPLVPDEIEQRVRAHGLRPILTGKRFGTVGFTLNGMTVEVTTFRLETYRSGSRKPDVVFVDDITNDLSRRDFTINAMALRADGRLVDPFGGQGDLRAQTIRTVGKPFKRFNEDPLRLLRAARFGAQLGFAVEPDTKTQMRKKASKILTVSHERWSRELDTLLLGPHVEQGLQLLADTTLLNFLIPELAIQIGYGQDSPYHELDLWEHTVKTVRLSPRASVIRWAALLHDVGKPYVRVKNRRGYSNYSYHELVGAELVTKIGNYLKWSNQQTREIHDLVLNHLKADSPLKEADTLATRKDPPG